MDKKTITGLYTGRTYAGCLEGIPDPAVFIKVAEDKAARLFGDGRPTLVIEPDLKSVPPVGLYGEEWKLLPQWTHIAMIEGPSVTKDYDGSHLVLIWFSDTSVISEMSYEILSRFDWNKEAKGFCY